MAGPPLTKDTTAITNATIVTTAETVVATLTDIVTRGASDPVRLAGSVNLTIGTGGALVTLRIRRTSVTGTAIATEVGETATAAAVADFQINGDDIPGETSGITYVLTAVVGSASGNSTVQNVYLRADY